MKKWYQSKTMWTAVLSGTLSLIGIVGVSLPMLEGSIPSSWYAYLLFGFSVANAILRKVTSTGIA